MTTPRTNELYGQWNAMTDFKMASKALELCEELETELAEAKEQLEQRNDAMKEAE